MEHNFCFYTFLAIDTSIHEGNELRTVFIENNDTGGCAANVECRTFSRCITSKLSKD